MPTGPCSPPSSFSLTGKAHRLWTVPTARSGGMAFFAMGDVMAEWQQCHAGWEIFVWYDALWPRLAPDLGVAGRAVATPRLIVFLWVQTLRTLGATC